MKNRMLERGIATVVGLFVLSWIAACASNEAKPIPQPTPDQVRSHGDRAFDKLKQEEQERGAQQPVPR